MLNKFLKCCQGTHECSSPCSGTDELKVISLTSDVMEAQLVQPVHLLTRQDSFDLTAALGTDPKGLQYPEKRKTNLITPRQKSFKDRLRLPQMRRYPVPPHCSPDDAEDYKRTELLRMYQEFGLDLHKGVHMTQLTANQDYSDIHCQILEDLQTLKVDQGSGCIIEFPLCAVSKVYRIVKNEDKWYSAASPSAALPLSNAKHIVVVEFVRRKLAFVLAEIVSAQCFLLCMELLIRRARECRAHAEQAANIANRKKEPIDSGPPVFVRGERIAYSESEQQRSALGSSGLLPVSPICATCRAEPAPIPE